MRCPSLWSVVRQLEAKISFGESGSHFQLQHRSKNDTVERSNNIASDDDEEFDSDASSISTTNTPSHLLNLFDNRLLDYNKSPASAPDRASHVHHSKSKHSPNITTLRSMMPNREVMVKVVDYTTPWLSVTNLLFPETNNMRDSEQLLSRFDKLSTAKPDLLELASLLISVALTVQQFPDEFRGDSQDRLKDPSAFVKGVNVVLERVVVNDDVLAGTLEGISTTLLYLRLQLGHASVSKMWLTLRRIIALAELTGLPRAASALNKYEESISETLDGTQLPVNPSKVATWRTKAEVWASICATDRLQSIMWSLPLATGNCPLPKRPIIDASGQLNPQAYQYSIIQVAARILDIDNLIQAGRPMEEIFQIVIETDQQMRVVDNMTPKGWQRIEWSEFDICAILQYWQQYITMRIHLQLALKYDGRDFAFNFVTCLGAAQELTKRYISLRPLLAPGFFANRVLDLQAFTGISFLLLAVCRGSYLCGSALQTADTDVILGLIDKAVATMRFAATRATGDFAGQAADSICSLRELLMQPQTSENQKITLHLALLGTIHVSRKMRPASRVPPASVPSQQPEMSWQPTTSNPGISHGQEILFDPAVNDFMDSLSYSMELPESYPLFVDQTSASEPWLTWSGWDGNIQMS